jgi:allophanate hydrolase
MLDSTHLILTITDYQTAYRENKTSPRDLLLELWADLERNGVGPKGDTAWIYLPTTAQRHALLDDLAKKSPIDCPLWGVPFAVKDNIDIAEWPTTAACPEFHYEAVKHATVVSALINAGAIPIGKTNLDQFATGLVGTRSPYGWVPNTFSSLHISGGSSSGSASTVARGLVCFSLGTDTAGSGRIPAGFNNLVGTKPTPGLVSIHGVVPACQTLDCVSIMSLTVADASLVLEVLTQHSEAVAATEPQFHAPIARQPFTFGEKLRVGVPINPMFTDAQYEVCFASAIEALKLWQVELVPIDMTVLNEIAVKLYNGPWVAERYLTAQKLLIADVPGLDSTVKKIIGVGADHTAAQAFQSLYDVRSLAVQAQALWQKMDVLFVPTAPGLPTYQNLLDDPIGANSALGCYTNFVNLLGWAALSTPAGFTESGLPFGVTWVGPGGTDRALLSLGQRWMTSQQLPLGCHLREFSKSTSDDLARPVRSHRIAVVGAHLSGMPLNRQLQAVGARLLEVTTTSPHYRLYALPNTQPPKPGLVRVEEAGHEIIVEVYDVPSWAVSGFLQGIPSPLGLGQIELNQGQWVTGFICEPIGLAGARDITDFGGWRAYMIESKT